MRWIDDGSFAGKARSEKQGPTVFANAWDEAAAFGRERQLAAALAQRAEDPARELASRLRAIELLRRCALPEQRDALGEAGGQDVARSLVRLSQSMALPVVCRGKLLSAIARLHGRPERLDWLLEGQVRLRNLQRFHGANGSDLDAGLLPAICDYFGELGEDGLSAVPVLTAAMADAELPLPLRRSSAGTVIRLAPLLRIDESRPVLLRCAALLPTMPELRTELLELMRVIMAADAAADARCRAAVLGLLDGVDALPKTAANAIIVGCGRMAAAPGSPLARDLFVLCGELRPRLPQLADILLLTMRDVSMRNAELFRDKVAGALFLRLLDEFAVQDQHDERMSVLSIGVTAMLRDAAADIAANDDPALRARILERADTVATAMQQSTYRAMNTAAAAWLRQRPRR